MDLLDSNRFSQSCVNDAEIILDRDKLAFIGKDGVILLNQAIHFCLERRLQMGEVKVLAELLAMQFLVVYHVETWVDLIKFGGGMLALAKDSPTVNIMQEGVKLVVLDRWDSQIQLFNVVNLLDDVGVLSHVDVDLGLIDGWDVTLCAAEVDREWEGIKGTELSNLVSRIGNHFGLLDEW
jgi:hypothetical protein